MVEPERRTTTDTVGERSGKQCQREPGAWRERMLEAHHQITLCQRHRVTGPEIPGGNGRICILRYVLS
jgi:hypothetical protein